MGLLVPKPSRRRDISYQSVLQEIVLRDFDGLWNQADNDLNLKTKYFSTLLNWERKEDATIGPRYGYTKYSNIINTPLLDAEVNFDKGTNTLLVECAGHGLVEGSYVTLSGFPSNVTSYLGVPVTELTKPLVVIGPITLDTFHILLDRWTDTTGTEVAVHVKAKSDQPLGDIVDIEYFQNRLVYVTDKGYIGSVDSEAKSRVLWSPSVVELATLTEDASPEGFLRTFNNSDIMAYDLGRALYNVNAAKDAAQNNNQAYFNTTIPSAITLEPPFEFFTDIPPRMKDGWERKSVLPGLGTENNNRLAKDVIARPRYPVVSNPGFKDQGGRIRIDKAPDGTESCIRSRVDNDFPNPDARFLLDSYPQGLKELGLSGKYFWQSDYEWGDPTIGDVVGSIGFGLWIGGPSKFGYDRTVPEDQDGVWLTPIWNNGTTLASGQLGAFVQIDSYHLNRKQDRDNPPPEMHGKRAGNHQLTRNAWINFDMHVKMNTPGVADGFIRFWINDVMVAEIKNAVLTLDGKWGIHGFLFNDRWGEVFTGLDDYVVPTLDESYYISQLEYWTPEEKPVTSEPVEPKVGSLIQLAGWSTLGGVPDEEINRVHRIIDITGDQYKFRVLTKADSTAQSEVNKGIARVSISTAWSDTPFASHAVHNRKLLIGNGRDKPVVVDFLETNSAQFLRDPATDSNVNTPIAKYVAVGANYTVWGGNPLEPGTIYISATGTNNTYEGDPDPNDATRMDVSKLSSSSNGEITGLMFHKGNLWVAFDNEYVIIQLGVYTEDLHTPRVVDTIKNFGGISHRAMNSVGELAYSTDTQGVIHVEESLIGDSLRPKYASELIAPHISEALSSLSILEQQEKVWAFYDKRMSRYMLFVPRGTGVYHTYVYTLLPERKVGGWQLFRGYDFTCGVRSELNRLFVAKGQNIYYLGTSIDEVYKDDGLDVEGVLEFPWMDFNRRNVLKKLRYMGFDTVGTATFLVSLFTDGYYEDLEQLANEHMIDPNKEYDEFTLPLIPQVEQWFAGADRGGWGGNRQTYGGGRRTARTALMAVSAAFKQLRVRLYFKNNKKMNLVSIMMSYQVGSIRR